MGLLLVSPVPFAPEMFPALRRFNAFIQSRGDCSDRVLFLAGGQPYGGDNEYSIEVRFYTGRPVVSPSCERAAEAAADPSVRWVIGSVEEVERCLSGDARARFRDRLVFNGMTLLSAYPLTLDGAVDLTPLARELQVAVDCKAGELPRSRYWR
jgi:hypothetical protein